MADVGAAGTRPRHHFVGVSSSPFLDGASDTSIRVSFTEDGVNSRSKNLLVSSVILLLSVILRFGRVIRYTESLSLEFSNAFLKLRNRG
jgi:hypothetical protein